MHLSEALELFWSLYTQVGLGMGATGMDSLLSFTSPALRFKITVHTATSSHQDLMTQYGNEVGVVL